MVFKMNLLFFLFLLFVPFFSFSDIEMGEEAFPIWENGTITKMEYVITLKGNSQEDTLLFTSHIFDSIYHFKDLSLIDSFIIRLRIDNQTKNSYFLKRIGVVSGKNKQFLYTFDCKEEKQFIVFQLKKRDFQHYISSKYAIQLQFQKNIF